MKQFLALKASAGSGKTFALTVRYITLLLLDAKPNEILTLTFTNKAASEMSERIYNTLLTLGDDEIYLDNIIKESGLQKQVILNKKNILLKKFRNSELSIYTIDKFVNKILREFCGYIGISDDFDIKEDDLDDISLKLLNSLDEKEFSLLLDFSHFENKKYHSIFDLFKVLYEKNEDFNTINIEKELIFAQKESLMKYAYIIKEQVLDSSLASNSAKKAVDFVNFNELLKKTWLNKSAAKEYSYFKKCCNDIIENNFTLLKEQLEIYFKLKSTYSLGNLLRLYHMFVNFKKSYNKGKNYLEFNDISNLVYDLLQNKIDKDFLYFRLDAKYKHMMIDEFQDTSTLQYKILEPLINEILSGSSSSEKSFFYVGDTKQSIYRFRGGRRELFDHLSNTFPLIDNDTLNTNYRSKENIVSFVNDIFLKVHNYEYSKQESINKEGYVEVFIDTALKEDEKFINVASKISYLLQNGVDINDVAILTYTNADVLSLYSYLSEKFPHLKISTEMTSRLKNQENVKALINAIKYLYFKEDIYKENLHALVGKKPLEELNINIDIQNNLSKNLMYVAKYLKLIDDNVIKLIDLSKSYSNIVSFVYEVDKLESSIENKEQHGLQILTIFKSKGLEFDTVLLLDRIKRKNIDRSSLLFEYEDVALKNIYYKIPNFEHYNEEYKNALLKEKALSRDDELNILYVAITRAKSNLIIFKKDETSVFDLLNLEAYQNGNLFSKEIIPKAKEKIIPIDYTALDLGKQEKQIKKEKDTSYTLHAKYFGLATHYTLEMMKDFALDSLSYALKLTKSRYMNYLSTADFISIHKRIKHLLENDLFISLLKEGRFIAEQAVMYKNEIKILDLLLYKNDGFIICDYKTTKDELHEHEVQVSYYKKAIADIFKTKNIKTYIIYLNENGAKIKETF